MLHASSVLTAESIHEPVADEIGIDSPQTRTPGLYFIECQGFIKIGISDWIKRRLIGLDHANPLGIKVIAVLPITNPIIARDMERALHTAFADQRHRGEWFRDSPRLRAKIATLKSIGNRQ
jgi:hypothetical protein